jgi:hypothetical protein
MLVEILVYGLILVPETENRNTYSPPIAPDGYTAILMRHRGNVKV